MTTWKPLLLMALAVSFLGASAGAQDNLAQTLSASGIRVRSNPYKDGEFQLSHRYDATPKKSKKNSTKPQAQPHLAPSEVAQLAQSLLGAPYQAGGTNPDGFDCSGYVSFVYSHFQVDLPHSSRLMEKKGKRIVLTETQPGDLIFFKGSDVASSKVGHVGIVVSQPGQAIKFIHASSRGIQFDVLDSDYYSARFISIKRLPQLKPITAQ